MRETAHHGGRLLRSRRASASWMRTSKRQYAADVRVRGRPGQIRVRQLRRTVGHFSQRQHTRQRKSAYRGSSGATWPSRPTWSPPRRPFALRRRGGGRKVREGKGDEERSKSQEKDPCATRARAHKREQCPRLNSSRHSRPRPVAISVHKEGRAALRIFRRLIL